MIATTKSPDQRRTSLRLANNEHRARPLSHTFIDAQAAATRARVTRLADISSLTPLGVPIYQAVRPLSRSLSVSQGKGLSPLAAKVSALLEAVEQDAAERFLPEGVPQPLSSFGPEHTAIWRSAPQKHGALFLDPDITRHWTAATNLCNGTQGFVPWDLTSLDFTRPPLGDVVVTSSGLATGNTPAEACASALAELLERDMSIMLDLSSPRERRQMELDLDTINAPVVRALLRRYQVAGCEVRVWSTGQAYGIAAFECALFLRRGASSLPPVGGSGCHTHREIALLRALLEGAQTLATFVAGARDDICVIDYKQAERRWFNLVLGSLSFGGGTVSWDEIGHSETVDRFEQIDVMLAVAAQRSSLPVFMIGYDAPAPNLAVVRVIAPGLLDSSRLAPVSSLQKPPSAVIGTQKTCKGPKGPVVFIGPSLSPHEIPEYFDVRPPAICGDLARLLLDPPSAVGLVDGYFEIAPSVWHKEILDLLAHGIPVYGAASLGALRAAELYQYGMIGVGVVFSLYRSGLVNRDDAVMLSHAPPALESRPLTVSLIDAEAALLQIDLPKFELRMLQRIVRTMRFDERTWPACLTEYRKRVGVPASVRIDALEAIPSLKSADVRTLLTVIATANGGESIMSPSQRPPMTGFYQAMLDTMLTTPQPSHHA